MISRARCERRIFAEPISDSSRVSPETRARIRERTIETRPSKTVPSPRKRLGSRASTGIRLPEVWRETGPGYRNFAVTRHERRRLPGVRVKDRAYATRAGLTYVRM